MESCALFAFWMTDTPRLRSCTNELVSPQAVGKSLGGKIYLHKAPDPSQRGSSRGPRPRTEAGRWEGWSANHRVACWPRRWPGAEGESEEGL